MFQFRKGIIFYSKRKNGKSHKGDEIGKVNAFQGASYYETGKSLTFMEKENGRWNIK